MFGYVKPNKPELTFRDFAIYRSVYCGLCKTISLRYGQLPRLTVSFDLSFFLLFIQSLQEKEPLIQMESCVLHPVKAHLITQLDPLLEEGANLALLLAAYKLEDDLLDREHGLRSHLGQIALGTAIRRAENDRPGQKAIIVRQLAALHQGEAEKSRADELASHFGVMLAELSQLPLQTAALPAQIKDALFYIMKDLGRWIFLADALDDYKEDTRKGKSFIPANDFKAAVNWTTPLMQALEENIYRTAELLPYRRYENIVANIIAQGLPTERMRISEGLPQQRV